MVKKTILAGVAALVLMAPIAYAQGAKAAAPAGNARGRILQMVGRNFQRRIQRGVKAGRITSDELAQLKTEMQDVRSKVQALRQAGTPPTAEQKQAVRQELRRINGEIFKANHKN